MTDNKTQTPVTTPIQPKNRFEIPSGKSARLLFPVDLLERTTIENLFIEEGTSASDIPRQVTEINLKTLNPTHVLFTVVAPPTALEFGKRPAKHKLKISAPIDVAKFMTSDDEDTSTVDIPKLVDALQKHVFPMVCNLSKDGVLKITGV